MKFKTWIESDGWHQPVLPFAQQEDPPDEGKIRQFKNKEDYIKSQTRYSTKTGDAAKAVINYPINLPDQEEVISIIPNAVEIPSYEFENGRVRPKNNIAFVHLQTKEPQNSTDPKYRKKKYRILAYWQGKEDTFKKEDIKNASPLGGLMGMGGYIMDVWVDPEFRGKPGKNIPNLYEALMKFAKKIGIHGLMPEDATCPNCGTPVRVQYDRKKCPNCGSFAKPLASKDFKAAQAKYDWKRVNHNND